MKLIVTTALALSFAAASFAQPATPRPAGEFRFTAPSGKPLDLANYRGKVVIAQFLYTTCPHCQATARMLTRLQSELGPRGLQVVGIAFNPEAKNPAAIEAFVKNNAVSFPVGAALADSVYSYLGLSAVTRFSVPQMLVIDRRGVIRAQSAPLGTPDLQREEYLRNLIIPLLK